MNHYFDLKFSSCRKIQEFERFEVDVKKKLHHFEMQSLKSKSKTIKFYNDVILSSKSQLESMAKDIKGFNIEMFLIGLALFHTCVIFKRKILLNEMGCEAFSHIAKSLLFGFGVGFLSGRFIASSFYLYGSYYKAYKSIDKLDLQFQKYYLAKHEEIFDD